MDTVFLMDLKHTIMKKLLLLFLVLAALKINSQNTYVPDDNFEQALIDLGYDAGALDDYVPTANINTVTELQLFFKNIEDLTGIEDFTALETFYCWGNNLENIDVSKNINLITLDITSNANLTSLDVSKNINLKTLNCNGNNLNSLNLKNGNNANLTLDARSNEDLLCIKVDDVAYAIANFTNIDSNSSFSLECGNTYVPDDVFEQELINKGYDSGPLDDYVANIKIENIKILNLSGKQITDLTGIEGFTALEQLFVPNTKLTSLDVSKNVNLKNLSCYSSQITSLDVSKNTALTNFRCDNNKLTQLNIKNGNNSNITNQGFNARNNPDLTCIEVDDVNYASTTWFSKDATATYNNNCHYNDTYIPDDNFEQALIDLGYDSGALDDYVQTANINTVATLDISSKGIIDLTGIEGFTALTSLNCTSNQLVNLDVSKNTALVNLQVNNNLLETLNFKNGINSTITSANFNAVNNANLTCIEVDDATYATSNWTQIDASATFSENCRYGQTYVPDDNFEQWLINLGYDTGVIDDYVPTANINIITTLSLFSKKIEDLTGVEAFTALETLSIVSNKLVTVDVSKNLALISLDLSQNELTTLDLSQNIALTNVNLHINKLTSLNIQNGANANISAANFKTTGNPDLACINVDDVTYATTNWTQIDSHTSFSLKCGFTYVPDDNFEQALIDLGYDAGALDDYVPDATIKTLTTLDISGKSIADLTGLQDFVALTSLNCSNNQLTVLNLSSNTALEILNASNNQIATISVDDNVALTSLDVSTNSIPTIDVSKNTSLTMLNVDANQLTNLDITNNTLVTNVSCKNNLLTSVTMVNDNNVLTNLDVSNNQLVAINVTVLGGLKVLNLENNAITNLDISKNDNLTAFNASNNQLQFLNFKNGANSAISTADFSITNNPSLTCVLVDDVSYTTTNWTNIDATTIFSLDCGLAYVPDDNFEKALINLGYDSGVRDNYVPIANISGVTTLNLYGKFVKDLTGIEYFAALEDLNCGFNTLTSLDLSSNKELKTLTCSNGQISNLNISQNTKLTSLDCSENNLSTLDISKNINLTSIICNTNTITNLDVTPQTSLTYLDCSTNKITSLLVPQNAPIEKLYCGKNSLTSLDVSTNIAIETLSFAENDIVSLDLKSNTTLHHLHAESNKLTSLELPKSVIKVDCSGNELVTLDVSNTPAMIELRCSNNKLTTLNVENSAVIQLYCANNQLTSLDLTTTRTIEFFASNNNLTSLNIKNGLNDRMDNGDFVVQNNPNLMCVQVDNATYSTNTWTRIDSQMSFNEDCTALSITDEVLEVDFAIYPNPVSDILNFKVENQQIKSVKIFNLMGKEVMSISANNNSLENINISQLSTGMYLIKLQTETTVFSRKIIKR
jgi:Leucine-rich repeat (LRR) protein